MRGNHPHGKPNTPLKGECNGNCNVTACQTELGDHLKGNIPQFYNEVMHAWYCQHCAEDIQSYANRDGLILFKELAGAKEEDPVEETVAITGKRAVPYLPYFEAVQTKLLKREAVVECMKGCDEVSKHPYTKQEKKNYYEALYTRRDKKLAELLK